MRARHFKMTSNSHNLKKNTDFRWEVPESSPSSLSLLLKCGPKWFPVAMYFSSSVGPSRHWGTKPIYTKYLTLDQRCFQGKILISKKEMWKLMKGKPHWRGPGLLEREAGRGDYHSMPITGRIVNCWPQEKNLNRTESSVIGPQTERCAYGIFYKKSTTSATQPMRNHHYSELLLLFNGPLFKRSPPNFFFSTK